MADDGNPVLARIAALRTSEECDLMEANCHKRGEERLAAAAKKRGIELRALADNPTDEIAKSAYEAVAAYESVLRIRHGGKRIKAGRTRRMLANRGVVEGVARVVGRDQDSVGYAALLEHGLEQYAFEHVVLRFPDRFSAEVRERAEARLSGAPMQQPIRRPRIADLLVDAGFDPAQISSDRAFLSQWAWSDGSVVVATVWRHEIEEGLDRAIYGPVDPATCQGVRLSRAIAYRKILAESAGKPIRVILQSKSPVQLGASPTAATRVVDPVSWVSEIDGDLIVLARQYSDASSIADTPWSDEELRATVVAYLDIAKAIAAGDHVVKKHHYEVLAKNFGRSAKAYEYRMQNISYVMTLIGRSWVPGLMPARNVGSSTIGRIERIIAEVESRLASGQALFEAQVKEARTRVKKGNVKPPGNPAPASVNAVVTQFVRDPAVEAWVLEAANGVCECCEQPAPFNTADGPFLEVHHVRHLSQKGSDSITNAVAICPNCHRRLHYAIDVHRILDDLYSRVSRLIKE